MLQGRLVLCTREAIFSKGVWGDCVDMDLHRMVLLSLAELLGSAAGELAGAEGQSGSAPSPSRYGLYACRSASPLVVERR